MESICYELSQFMILADPSQFYCEGDLGQLQQQSEKFLNIPDLANEFAERYRRFWPKICANQPAARGINPNNHDHVLAVVARAIAKEAVTIFIAGILEAVVPTGCLVIPFNMLKYWAMVAFTRAAEELSKG